MNRSYPLRVGYDAQAFLSPNGGLGKGVQLRNLLGPYAGSFGGFATPGRNYSEQSLIQGGFSRYKLWQQISLPVLLRKWKADVFLAPYNTAPLLLPSRTRMILVLHDLILQQRIGLPAFGKSVNDAYRRLLIRKAVPRAHIVLTVSAYSRQQIISLFPAARVHVIPCTIDPSWFVNGDARKVSERQNYILAVTGNVPHKNPHRALEGYAALVRRSDRSQVPTLRLVGLSSSAEEFRRLASSLQISNLVRVEPYMDEATLQNLYRGARAVIVPSLMEGFGIPVLEAMASGTPLIASNATSLPEVGGEAGAYFDPSDASALADTLKRVLDDPNRQLKMIELGLAQAKKYHPAIVGQQVEDFWEMLALESSQGTR